MRRLQPGDEPALLAFYATHTPETLRQRYGYYPALMSPNRAAELVGVDQSRDAALGIFEESPRGPRLAAVARYCLAPGQKSAEVAFVVREDRRRLGLARTLLQALAAIGRERGLTHLTAQTAGDNQAMLGLFRRSGATLLRVPGINAFAVTLPLSPAPIAPRKVADGA